MEKHQGDQSEKTGGGSTSATAFIGVSAGNAGQVNSFGLVSLNTSGGLEAIRMLSS